MKNFKQEYFEYCIYIIFFISCLYFIYTYLFPSKVLSYRTSVGKHEINNFKNIVYELGDDPDYKNIIINFSKMNSLEMHEKIQNLIKKRNSNIDEKFYLENLYINSLLLERAIEKVVFWVPISVDIRYTNETRAYCLASTALQAIYYPDQQDYILKTISFTAPYEGILGQYDNNEDKIFSLIENAYTTYPTFKNGSIYLNSLLIKYKSSKNLEERKKIIDKINKVEKFHSEILEDNLRLTADYKYSNGYSEIQHLLLYLKRKEEISELWKSPDSAKLDLGKKYLNIYLNQSGLSSFDKGKLLVFKLFTLTKSEKENKELVKSMFDELALLNFATSNTSKIIGTSSYYEILKKELERLSKFVIE